MMSKSKIFVISGPSCSGKGALIRATMHVLTDLRLAVSHTTRKQRLGEMDGVNYHFVTIREFEEMVRRGEFAEWARFPPKTGHFYGTSLKELSKGQKIVLEIDLQGAKIIKGLYPEAVMIFVKTNLASLKERMLKRGDVPETEIPTRLSRAEEEMSEAEGVYDFIVENNDGEAGFQKALYILVAHMNT